MVDIGDYLDRNKIRIIVCLLLLALGLYVVNTLKNRRSSDNIWLITLFITVAAVVGMWFTLAGTVPDIKQKGKQEEQPDSQAFTNDSMKLVVPINGSLPYIELDYSSPMLLVGDFIQEMARSRVKLLHVLGKRACDGTICPALKGGNNTGIRAFFRRNKTRLITTSTTTTAGATGAYTQRKAERRVVLVGVVLTIGIAVGLWFLIGEDLGTDSEAS